ncbi:MAG: hypothetical protein ACQESM_00415 [Bacteroidota bacterium]
MAGLLTGILIGIGLFFIFQSGQEKKSPQFVQKEEPKTEPDKTHDNEPSNKKPQTNTEKQKIKDTIPEQKTDSIETASSQATDTLNEPQDTSKKSLNKDTTQYLKDSLSQNQNNDIVIMEDQLIDKQTVAINFSQTGDNQKTSKNLDSLLIDDQTKDSKELDSITIEYWKSPINYKGYRRIYNRLIIFGFTPKDSIEIFWRKKQLFMQLRDKIFPLDETNNFRSIWFNQ